MTEGHINQLPEELIEDGIITIDADDSFETKVMKVMMLTPEIRNQLEDAANETLDVLWAAEERLSGQKTH